MVKHLCETKKTRLRAGFFHFGDAQTAGISKTARPPDMVQNAWLYRFMQARPCLCPDDLFWLFVY
ncbi:hypothetical protein DXT89_12850 [Agrobacterium vitis]|uniref:Uncharacterized protein n=1 Tax=Agrobacterium vitis TaxID=373 RepID=A0A368NUZ4_AGRVI|nr:hypothetical protein DXM22_06860 [Agrobacterium vitis]KAA3526843.1 hypothetical protein DXT89_12850 [Agrobacterium vitis]RCU53031.1 hypothetical protein ASB66_015185 [Agrobacterium vitis]